MRARSALALAVVAAAVTLALVAGARGGGADRPRALAGDVRLPDLAQERPSGIEVSRAGALARPRWRLGFDSAVSNIGAGPLRIASRRAMSAAGRMSADQLIDRSGGGRQHIPTVKAFTDLMTHHGFETVTVIGGRPQMRTVHPVLAAVDKTLSRRASLARRFYYIGRKVSQPAAQERDVQLPYQSLT